MKKLIDMLIAFQNISDCIRGELTLNIDEQKQVRALFHECRKHLHQNNDMMWIDSFQNYFEAECSTIKKYRMEGLLKGQFFDSIVNVKEAAFKDVSSPILICVVKNEKLRLKHIFPIYRKLGIHQFAIIDNDSTDGSMEFCLEQPDTAVFSVKEIFSSPKHVGWINQLLSKYGFQRWYLIIDADEILDYAGSERYAVQDIIHWAEKNHIDRIRALQVEMYTKKALFSEKDDNIDWFGPWYFDVDSYEKQDMLKCPWILGGPRKRILHTYSLLTKFPLFFLREDDLNISMHYLYPYEKNFLSPCVLALKHYEFINHVDFQHWQRIISQGIFASGSREYKEMNQWLNPLTTFYFSKSCAYHRSEDLLAISELKRIMI